MREDTIIPIAVPENNKKGGGNRRKRMLYRDAKKDYILYLRHEQGATERTITTYQSWLNRYERWLHDLGHRNAEIDVALSKSVLQRY